MDPRNLFCGLESELHAVREERSHTIFADVYEQTVHRVDRAAKAIAPKHCHFSMSERIDYVQEGYAGLWKNLDSYRWICPRCDSRYSSVWGFDVHGCKASKPKYEISEYASFVTRRAMKHYQIKHIRMRKDERKSIGVDFQEFSKQPTSIWPFDTTDLVHQKTAIDLLRDMVCFESDDLIRFVVDGALNDEDGVEIRARGLELGMWQNQNQAYKWFHEARENKAFASYIGVAVA